MGDGITKNISLVFDANTAAADAKLTAFMNRTEAKLRKYYSSQAGSATAAKARRDSGYGLSTPLETVKQDLIRAGVERAVEERLTKERDTANKKRARVEERGLAQNKKINNAKLRETEAYNRSYYKLSQQSRVAQDRADRQFSTAAAKNAAIQWQDVKQKRAQWKIEDNYKAAIKSGDFRTASRLEGAAIKGGARPLTPGQRKQAGGRMAGQGAGGYGQYVMAYALGGQAGLIGLSMRQEGYKKLGTGLMVGGAIWKAASGTIGLARRGADLLGLNSDTLQNYAEFDKALKLATNNLRAGLGSEQWAALSPGVTDRMRLVDKKLKNAAMSLAAQYGGAGNATDVGNLFRAMSGVGGLRNGVAQDVIDVSRVAMKLSMISEETSPEEAGKGIMAISNAAKAQGIKNLGFDQIAAAMYKAGALSPLMVSDLTKNAGNIAMAMTGGASLSEALGSYMLLTSAGYSGARAGTQLSSLQLRMPTVLRKKGFGKILGISDNELANLGPLGFIKKLTSQANREGLNTTYGITPGDNPLKSKALQNDIAAIIGETFGLRGGQLEAFMATTVGDDEARAKFEGWISMLTDSTTLLQDFNGAVRVVSKTTANRMANAQNAIENIKFSIWEVLSPWIGMAGEKAAITLEQTRLNNNLGLSPPERAKAQAVLDERKSLLENPETLRAEQLKEYGGTMFEPFIKLGEVINSLIGKITPEGIESFVSTIATFVTGVTTALAGLISVLASAAMAIMNLPFFSDKGYTTVFNALAADPKVGKMGALRIMGQLTPEEIDSYSKMGAEVAQIDKFKNVGWGTVYNAATILPTDLSVGGVLDGLNPVKKLGSMWQLGEYGLTSLFGGGIANQEQGKQVVDGFNTGIDNLKKMYDKPITVNLFVDGQKVGEGKTSLGGGITSVGDAVKPVEKQYPKYQPTGGTG